MTITFRVLYWSDAEALRMAANGYRADSLGPVGAFAMAAQIPPSFCSNPPGRHNSDSRSR
jgi:hypothetical protein